MAITPAQLAHDPDFQFPELVRAQDLAAAITAATSKPLILGPESSYCPHNGERIYDPHSDEIICLICGDFVSHAQLEAERTTPEPAVEIELP